MTEVKKRFMLVDDDPSNNAISKMLLRRLFGEIEINEFIFPEVALEFIKTRIEPKQPGENTILLLDINMPILSGWEFLALVIDFIEKPINKAILEKIFC